MKNYQGFCSYTLKIFLNVKDLKEITEKIFC